MAKNNVRESERQRRERKKAQRVDPLIKAVERLHRNIRKRTADSDAQNEKNPTPPLPVRRRSLYVSCDKCTEDEHTEQHERHLKRCVDDRYDGSTAWEPL